MNLLLPTVRATRPTFYILLDSVMPIKPTINYKCTISLYILHCASPLPTLSWHRLHNGRCVYAACCCLTQFATYMSRFGCRQFTALQHLYCKSILTAVTCARLVSGQCYLTYFILHFCYLSPFSSNTNIELRETDLSVMTCDCTGNILDRLT